MIFVSSDKSGSRLAVSYAVTQCPFSGSTDGGGASTSNFRPIPTRSAARGPSPRPEIRRPPTARPRYLASATPAKKTKTQKSPRVQNARLDARRGDAEALKRDRGCVVGVSMCVFIRGRVARRGVAVCGEARRGTPAASFPIPRAGRERRGGDGSMFLVSCFKIVPSTTGWTRTTRETRCEARCVRLGRLPRWWNRARTTAGARRRRRSTRDG